MVAMKQDDTFEKVVIKADDSCKKVVMEADDWIEGRNGAR